ncbi:hypothetical protein LJB89_02255 [Tyzzerella sp. OttesenSCG-928-J15]|nr:hypothetical protein [Tyzzerella sp. OttesenSCG-928-J15]
MRGTKIMALQLKEIIKTLIFVVAGIILVLVLVNLFTSKDDNANESGANYIPGAYSVNLQLNKGSIDVQVTVTEDKITDIAFKNLPEDQQVFYPLFQPTMEMLSASIIENQSLEVALPEDRCITGQVLISAIDKALAQATAQ